MLPLLAFTPPGGLPRRTPVRSRTGNKCPICAQTPTGGRKPSRSEREAEIAAKIEQLRRQQKLKSQRVAREAISKGDDPVAAVDSAEGMYLSDIEEGEAFFGTRSTAPAPNSSSSSPAAPPSKQGTTTDYRPRVSTWGVFPRPDNISRAYGGGRKLPLGGEKEQGPEEAAKDARIREKLARYMGGSVEEAQLEAEHAADIEAALASAEAAMASGRAFDAARALDAVLGFTTARSRRGGEIRIALALAYEETGRRGEARQIYTELARVNKFNDIKRTVRRLNAGFDAEQKMRTGDDAGDSVKGFGKEFVIPDLAAKSEKRYATVIREGKDPTIKKKPRDKGQEAVIAVVVLAALVGLSVFFLSVLTGGP